MRAACGVGTLATYKLTSYFFDLRVAWTMFSLVGAYYKSLCYF